MKKHKNNGMDILILKSGEELFSTLEMYAEEDGLNGAWLQSGLGGASSVVLSFYDLEKKEYIDKTFDESLQILSLQGNLTWDDGKPFWHIHGTFSTDEYRSIGGHIKRLEISPTGELLIMPLEAQLHRIYDETTRLKVID